jgi:hypothetical protein
MIDHTEIRWNSEPQPFPESTNLLLFTETELLSYARGLQNDTHWLRRLLSEAFTLIERQQSAIATQREKNARLTAEYRALRERVLGDAQ